MDPLQSEPATFGLVNEHHAPELNYWLRCAYPDLDRFIQQLDTNNLRSPVADDARADTGITAYSRHASSSELYICKSQY